MSKNISRLAFSSAFAALYLALTFLSFALGLDKGVIQCRLSECLCVLCGFFPGAVGGLTVGCFLADLLIGCHPLDIAVGTVATCLGCVFASLIGRRLQTKRRVWVLSLPAFFCSVLLLPPIMIYVYGAKEAYLLIVCSIAVGEFLSAVVLGTVLGRVTLVLPFTEKVRKNSDKNPDGHRWTKD
ncbi:MAG: QueT transporter family protein [Clostridia bacterium]|nr:QueT transporter family protein [Clostridia bacterium]